MKKYLLLILTSCLTFVSSRSFAQCSEDEIINLKKIAIVFGEKDYKHAGSLTNPINDALDISDSLKKVGFEVVTYQNADLKTMNTAIDDWCLKLSKYDVALFYYSGHGAEVNGENFIFPVDANPQGPSDLFYTAISANKLLARLDNINLKYSIMILDACRNNPFTRNWFRDIGKGGLASMAGKGTFIGFAASPGNTASDGDKRNGIYTEAILNNITKPNLTIDQIFTKVNSYVRERTLGKQIPFKNSSFSTDFCFSVTMSKKNGSTEKMLSYSQPSSAILINTNQHNIFTIDSLNSGFVNRDGKTLNLLSTVSTLPNRPFQLTARTGELLFALDSVNRTLLIFDWKKKGLKSKIPLLGVPYAIALSVDEKKAYISQNNSGIGSLTIIDVVLGKISKTINFTDRITGIVIGADGKYLYSISSSNLAKASLNVIDIKSDKVIKNILGLVRGDCIGISPNGKKLYISSKSSTNAGSIKVLDANNLKIIGNINVNSTGFSFTTDNKYMLAYNKNEISIIAVANDEIVTTLPFATEPKGVTVGSDGSTFVWLPQENRIFTFDIIQQIKNSKDFDPETNLKRFKDDLQKSSITNNFLTTKAIFDEVDSEFRVVVNELIKDLGDTYGDIQTGYDPDYKNQVFRNQLGIISRFDNTKKIWPVHEIKIVDNELILNIIDTVTGKSVSIKSNVSSINLKDLHKAMRNFFLDRLNQLK